MAEPQEGKEILIVARPVLASVFRVAAGTIDKWLQEAPPLPRVVAGTPGKAAQYSIPDCVAWFVRRLEAKHGGPGLNPLEERARKERAQGQLAEQTFKARAGELLPAAEVERMWAAEVMAVKTKLLAWQQTLADRLHRTSTLEGLPGVERVLREAVRDVLTEFADAEPPADADGLAS